MFKSSRQVSRSPPTLFSPCFLGVTDKRTFLSTSITFISRQTQRERGGASGGALPCSSIVISKYCMSMLLGLDLSFFSVEEAEENKAKKTTKERNINNPSHKEGGEIYQKLALVVPSAAKN